jgi:HK97 family phage major capsid protein
VASGENGAFANGDALMTVFHTLKAQYLPGASWLMARSVLAEIRKLKDSTGQYIWQPSLIAGTPTTLLGCPVAIADDMPVLDGEKPTPSLAFGNFREAYQIVDRAGLHILRDPFSAKPYVEFYATKRVGGDVINFDAIKLIHFVKE